MDSPILFTAMMSLVWLPGPILLVFGFRSLSRAREASRWPIVKGSVQASKLITRPSDEPGDTFETEVSYTYRVNGKQFRSDKVAFGYRGCDDEQFHQEIYDALPVNAHVAVRYAPNDPTRAVLAHGANRSVVSTLVFGTVWTLGVLSVYTMAMLSEVSAEAVLRTVVMHPRD